MATQHEMELIDSATRAQQALEEELGGERMIINMGPQHPSTHGVYRAILTIDGEYVVEAENVCSNSLVMENWSVIGFGCWVSKFSVQGTTVRFVATEESHVPVV